MIELHSITDTFNTVWGKTLLIDASENPKLRIGMKIKTPVGNFVIKHIQMPTRSTKKQLIGLVVDEID